MVRTCDREIVSSRLPAGALSGSLGQLSLPSLRVGQSSTGLMAGVKAECVHLLQVASNTV